MLETSKDLLYIVIAFCVLWFTAFLCWLMYYLISMLKNIHSIIKAVKDKIALVDDLFKNIKQKVDNSAMYIGILANGITKIIEVIKDKKDSHSEGKEEKKKKKNSNK